MFLASKKTVMIFYWAAALCRCLTLGSTVGTMVGTGSSVGAVSATAPLGGDAVWPRRRGGHFTGRVSIAFVRKFLSFMTMSEEMSHYTGGSNY